VRFLLTISDDGDGLVSMVPYQDAARLDSGYLCHVHDENGAHLWVGFLYAEDAEAAARAAVRINVPAGVTLTGERRVYVQEALLPKGSSRQEIFVRPALEAF
jgi:hypothetical protein